MGAVAAIFVASQIAPNQSPNPTSSERVYMGYYGILWESMEINGKFRSQYGFPQPKQPLNT